VAVQTDATVSAGITITFLGTGSGVPTLQRNLACVALQREGELFLLDAGEAAQIGMRRAGLGWARLEALLISHMHGDHVTGLPGVMMSLQMIGREAPLTVIGPPGIGGWIRCFRRSMQTGFSYEVRVIEADGPGVVWEMPDYQIVCAPLDHRLFCLGFSLRERPRPGRFNVAAAVALGVPMGERFGRLQRGEAVEVTDEAGTRLVTPDQVLGPPRPGLSVAYCTDTRPCESSVELARGADLLIHEGTFDATMPEEAAAKGHSTVVEAAEIARAAGVRRLMITHISPRYGDVELLKEQARAVFLETSIARDGKVVTLERRETDE
jgi:ribonuclease Z